MHFSGRDTSTEDMNQIADEYSGYACKFYIAIHYGRGYKTASDTVYIPLWTNGRLKNKTKYSNLFSVKYFTVKENRRE